MARILRDLTQRDAHTQFVSLSDYVEGARPEIEEFEADMKRACRAAVGVIARRPNSYYVERKYREKLESPDYKRDTYESLYPGVRVSPADANRIGEIEQAPCPEMRLRAWRKPGVRFQPPGRAPHYVPPKRKV